VAAETQRMTQVEEGEGPAYWQMGGTLVTCKAVAADTEGRYSLFEVDDAPDGGPPMHRHTREDESYFILEGEYEVHFPDGSNVRLSPGAFARIPMGTVHTYWCIGPNRGRMLVLATPGGLEDFFAELGDRAVDRVNPPTPSGPPDFGAMVAIAAKHGIEVVGPPAR